MTQKDLKTSTKNEIQLKCESLLYHNQKYHGEDCPEITDFEYDTLRKKLEKLLLDPKVSRKEKNHIQITLQKVGAEIKVNQKKFTHPSPMLSMDNAMNQEELEEFIDKRNKDLNLSQNEYWVSLKFDGMALELIYEKGLLSVGATRGDGLVGEDITHNITGIIGIPKDIRTKLKDHPDTQKIFKKPLIIRGEAIMDIKSFKKTNCQREKDNLPLFSNPRNATAGNLRQIHSQSDKTGIIFFAYQLANPEDFNHPNLPLLDNASMMKWINGLGFDINYYSTLVNNLSSLNNYYQNCFKKREELEYEIDGIVVKLNKKEHWDILGVAGKKPRYSIAWKFPPTIKQTILEKVKFQVGRTGIITPVAILKPININGAIIKRATLHNKKEIQQKDLFIGDTVDIIRSGEVIPKILKSYPEKRKGDEKQVIFPQLCPICQSQLIEEKSESLLMYCNNIQCPAIIREKLIHFVSKEAMNIDGLGSEFISELFKKKIIQTLPDIYRITGADLDKFERMGDKLKSNLLNSIEKSKNISLDKFIFALGIKGVGSKTAKNISKKFLSLEQIFLATLEELTEMEDIGEISAKEIFNFFTNESNQKMLKEFKNLGLWPVFEAENIQGVLSGKKVLFTGTLSIPRRMAKEKAEKLGAEIISFLSKNTNYLIIGENPGSKLKKATEMGIEIMTEKEFLSLS